MNGTPLICGLGSNRDQEVNGSNLIVGALNTTSISTLYPKDALVLPT